MSSVLMRNGLHKRNATVVSPLSLHHEIARKQEHHGTGLLKICNAAGLASQYLDQDNWFELGCKALAEEFTDGMQFIVVTPAFQTLRQQTFDRIVKAKLAEASADNIVIPAIWASKVNA